MSNNIRQNNIFVAENWKKLYQTFREADFQSYDFETIRKSMIDYLQVFYPEDFNDFIESSEYIALIDLIAFTAQSLAFRADLNTRENFLETAERRDSVLRLAKLLSYNPKRTQTAKGLLKLDAVSTTETVFDSNGINLANTQILWNDSTNSDFLEQIVTILNAAFLNTQRFGKPAFKDTINGIRTEEYQLNLIPNTLPVYEFSKTVNGTPMTFELVNGTYAETGFLIEPSPKAGKPFNIIFRNDGRGNDSINTGFFVAFKQGTSESADFNIPEKVSNKLISVNINNIDNDDVWLHKLDENGVEDTEWEKVPAVAGTNIIFNSLSDSKRNLFAVGSRNNDQIDLIFADGVFADNPIGNFRVRFRTSNGLTYKILPKDMQGVTIDIPYVSRTNQLETLSIELSLRSTVANANARETINNIKINAPQQFYTQNRMINGEDYQIFPLTNFNEIVKVKTLNRTSSGISRFLDVKDTTGKYSSTNIFADDGLLYRFESVFTFNFEFVDRDDIQRMIQGQVEPILRNKETQHFFFKNFPTIDLTTINIRWNQSTTSTNLSTGFFEDSDDTPLAISTFSGSDLKFLENNALVKFVPPIGFHFKNDGTLGVGAPGAVGTKAEIWTLIKNVIGDGSNFGTGKLSDGTGPVVLNNVIPSLAEPAEVYVPFAIDLPASIESAIINNVFFFTEFGLTYDYLQRQWIIIDEVDLNKADTFDLTFQGDTTASGKDNSWMLKFETDGEIYTVKYRSLAFFFESLLQTRFFFDENLKIFDPRIGKTIKDGVKVLKINTEADSDTSLGQDHILEVIAEVTESDGFSDNTKIKITYADSDDDGVPDDPQIFERIIAPDVNPTNKLLFFNKILDEENFERWIPVDIGVINKDHALLGDIDTQDPKFLDGQIFYTTTGGKFYILTVSGTSRTVAETVDYFARIGRRDLLFQYTHNSPNNRRIDPSPNNFMDIFVLTRQYETDFRAYIQDFTNTITEPQTPSIFELREQFGSIESVKPISDALIFNPVKFKPLFGLKADPALRAKFKIVKNTSTLITDSDLKSQMISALNEYFAIQNWEFGDTFFFSELAAFLHVRLSPNIDSIVIVPTAGDQTFGSLQQINSKGDEIFISAATVNDIETINAITAAKLRANGNVINSTELGLT